MLLFAIIVIVGYVVYAMSPAERVRVIEAARGVVEPAWDAYCRWRRRPDAFREALTARTRVPFVTLAVVVINVVVFVSMVLGHGRMDEADTLVRWGGSAGPWTTNGEWWRVLTATVVHTGFVQLAVEMAALSQA